MKTSRTPQFLTLAVLVFFYLPLVVMVIHSFNQSKFGTKWQGFTWKWYDALWQRSDLWDALLQSLGIAGISSMASMLLGTAAAISLHRHHTRIQKFHGMLLALPLVLPEILIGMSLLSLFVALNLRLGFLTVTIAHITFCVGYVAMIIRARLQDFDDSILDAARDLGASPWQTWYHVTFPLLMPGILAGGLLAFTLSIDDFVITFFVSGPGADTLPLKINSMMRHSKELPVINALSTLLLTGTILLVAFAQRLLRMRAI
ncbi:MAG: ABC transporter permease [Akkermansiaceae bacterium]|jgi:spermidine/putrescine transport system permease protein